ncbi:TRAP transporter small permease subunit [Teredinibacter waterburyi]|jgi:TRAP-type mannitol/chloroaromatic compound transport system, small permease component|uniref:TRAP transporter small permease subunit n=1 Tax=Teredinibacter waterburyi TaxID=1500538 RepID=UPI00165EF66F|nr:TRAP transporter small permease subunit [Teredinibacter waterburyi]
MSNLPTSNTPVFARLLGAFSSGVDRFSAALGNTLSWLTLLMVILVAGIVIARALFNVGSIAVQESVTYLHAIVLTLCLAYNLQQGGHVRVDVFYGRFRREQKAWVDAVGSIVFLIPFALFLLLASWRFVAHSWLIRETSADPGGLPFVFVLKTLMPLAGVLLALQALSEVARNLLIISWRNTMAESDSSHLAENPL